MSLVGGAFELLKAIGLSILVQIAFWSAFALVLTPVGMLYRRLKAKRARGTGSGDSPTGELRERVLRWRRPALLLVPAPRPGFSKLGGTPELPSRLRWPRSARGPLAFLAQLDLAEVQELASWDWLPTEGRLHLFYDQEQNGARDLVQVLYGQGEASKHAVAQEQTTPQPFGERRISFHPFDAYPSSDWLEVDETVDIASLEDGRPERDDGKLHWLGGYPSEIQGGQMQIKCEFLHRGVTPRLGEAVPDTVRRAAREWRLLLQIDSDPELGMSWGDGGCLYVFVRARDAKRGDFSKTVTIMQSH